MHHRHTPLLMFALAGLLCSAPGKAESGKETQADVLALALPAAAYLVTRKEDDRAGRSMLAKSLGVAAAGTLALNALIDKDSPNGESAHAFPSGHTTIAFSSAAFIQRRYGGRYGIPAYVAASYVGWLRVETDDHDAGDVLGGAALGILSSYLMTRPAGDNLQLSAWGGGKAAGIRFDYRW